MRKLLLFALFAASTCLAQRANTPASQQSSPATQVRWPANSGHGAPTSPVWVCNSGTYGQPYTDIDANQQYTCSASGWVQLSVAGGGGPPTGAAGGSLAGSYPNPSFAASGVTAGTYVAGATSFTINAAGNVTAAGPAFAVTAFTCGACASGPYETGNPVVTSASGTASYASPTVPASASVTDGTHVVTLTTPFTSWTQAHSYATNTCFTLTAIGNSQTVSSSPQCVSFLNRSFGGTGTGGSATSATASGNNAVLVGATGTLSIGSLDSSCAGQVYNVTTSGTQFVYLLLPCNVSNPNGGSFTTPGPTVFVMNAPTAITFTNQFSASVTMYLYRSTNSFFSGSNFIITVGN